jgi:hypothetical protein
MVIAQLSHSSRVVRFCDEENAKHKRDFKLAGERSESKKPTPASRNRREIMIEIHCDSLPVKAAEPE